MNELLCIPYSPWSEKARWALDFKKVEYRSRAYQPLIGELGLRWKLRRFSGTVSVPVFTTSDGKVLNDSAAIARWADQHGSEPHALFPADSEGEVDRFIALGERGLSAGRALSLVRMQGDAAALTEMVPRSLRGLGGAARKLASLGVDRTLRKYGGHRIELAEHERVLTETLDQLRGHIKDGAPLLGSFTFADIAAAQLLTFIKPPAFGVRIGKASRRTFTDEKLSVQYADLLQWRDGLYEKYRPRPAK